jgi:UPF0755 protein
MIRIRNKRRFIIFILIMSLLVALLSAAIFTIWLSKGSKPFDPGNTETMLVTIPRGTSTSGIGEILESKGLISSSTLFRLKTKFAAHDGKYVGSVTFCQEKEIFRFRRP